MTTSLSRDLIFLILQFLDEEKFKETGHMLDRVKAVDILTKDLKVFSSFNGDLFKEITQLLILDNFSCRNSTDSYTQVATSNQLTVSAQKTEGFLPMCANGPFQLASTPVQTPLNASVSTPSSMSHPVVSGAGVGLDGPTNPTAVSKGFGDSNAYYIHSFIHVGQIMLPGMSPFQSNSLQFNMTEELPKTVACTLNQGSVPTSMDFHPIQQTLLLAGTNIGEISLWEVSAREKLVSRNFQVWDIGASSMTLKAALIKDPSVSVRRILWSPDGSLFAEIEHMESLGV
ncbi:hypothetical protein CRYUN_Cryun33cG0103000 [Craigia yunnanensis]